LKERTQVVGKGRAEGEADSPLSRKPDPGLDPRTRRSGPESKADAQGTESPRHPLFYNLFFIFREKCVGKPQMFGRSTPVFCTF